MLHWATIVALGVALFFAAAWLHDRRSGPPLIPSMATDFHEFYCAGASVLQRVDPYHVDPHRSCMYRIEKGWYQTPVPAPGSQAMSAMLSHWYATPAPLPGYALAVFAAFATIPFPVAQFAWETLLVACTFVAALALSELTCWPFPLILLCLIPTVGFLNLIPGELTPIVAAALCLGALALERGFPWLAAFCAGVAMIEPHVGLPALAALLLLIPQARPWALGVTAALAVISVATIGLATNVEYFRSVLPLQALSEVPSSDQFSLTHVLALLGTSPSTALLLGSASYVVMAIIGVLLAARLRFQRLAYVLLVPSAVVMFGGSFIHDVQIAAALPAALLLAADVRPVRTWAILAAILLIVQVGFHGLHTYISTASLLAVAALMWTLLAGRGARLQVLGLTAAAFAAAVVVLLLSALPHPAIVSSDAIPPLTPDENASEAWGALIRLRPERMQTGLRFLIEKVPVWFGLVLLIGCAVRASALVSIRQSEREAPPSRGSHPEHFNAELL